MGLLYEAGTFSITLRGVIDKPPSILLFSPLPTGDNDLFNIKNDIIKSNKIINIFSPRFDSSHFSRILIRQRRMNG